LNELDDRSNYRGVWGVWTAEPSNVRLHARPHGAGWRLDGTKTGCAGARYLTDALVTCRCDSGKRLLISVPLRQPGVMVGPDRSEALGMADARIVDVAFTGAIGTRIGGADAYTDRPGFWHGAMGKAACWYGGAVAVATMLREHCATVTDSRALAHLGAVDVALSAARSALWSAALQIDCDPRHRIRTLCYRTRGVVEHAVYVTLDHGGKALGAGVLDTDALSARRFADLQMLIRQSHSDHDLVDLATDALREGAHWTL
jgi:hypothetical protein